MINQSLLDQFKADYQANPMNFASQQAIAKVGLQDASVDNNLARRHNFQFSHETKRGTITNQKSSGRCWMFAALNTARINTMTQLNLESFEFSQNYTLFWDKLEKSNYFLESIIETADQALNSRLVQHLLKDPIQDGGQWDMFADILRKYGAVPKSVMPETYHSSNTNVMNDFITSKLREFACGLRDMAQNGSSHDELMAQKDQDLSFIYNVLVKCLGEVPTVFDLEYRDKDKTYHRISNLTPQSFFKDYVGWDLDNRVSLINAPTCDKPFGKRFTVNYLGTVKEAGGVNYINAPIDILKQAAINSIKDGQPVWFGCDVAKMLEKNLGVMDQATYHYEATLGQTNQMTKAQRLDYGDSLLTHAMVFVGVDLDEQGQPVKWKVENSWGDDRGDKGIFSMSDAWFEEYNYQIAVDKQYIPQDYLASLSDEIIELEPWDPMGALAMTH